MTKFFNKFKKPCFWPIFPILGAKKIPLENLALSRTTLYGFLAPCQNVEKTKYIIPRKHPDRQKDRLKNRRILLATAGGPKKGFYHACTISRY